MLNLVDYVAERQAATYRRRQGLPRPWSRDPIIAEKFLCSVIRDDDRTCREAITYIALEPDSTEQFRLARCFRYLNWVPSWIAAHRAGVLGDAKALAALLRAREAAGEKYLGAQAFKINVKGGVWNIDGIADCVARLYTSQWIGKEPTARGMVAWLIERKFGPFMSYQVMQDIRWTGHRYSDEDAWALVGPGAARGLLRLAGRYDEIGRRDQAVGGMRTWLDRRHDAKDIAMQGVSMPREMKEALDELLPLLRAAVPEINMFEVEHNLCEWDKYCRIATGESKGRKFVPRS